MALCIALRCTALRYFASHMHVYFFVLHIALVHIDILSLELASLTSACNTSRSTVLASGFHGNVLHCIAIASNAFHSPGSRGFNIAPKRPKDAPTKVPRGSKNHEDAPKRPRRGLQQASERPPRGPPKVPQGPQEPQEAPQRRPAVSRRHPKVLRSPLKSPPDAPKRPLKSF